MTATSHALTGAFIGLAVGNPIAALPLAFLSHFVCDAIPHYDVAGESHEARLGSKRFLYILILFGAVTCLAIVLALTAIHRGHWVTAIFSAFAATSPDLLSIPRFLSVRRGGRDIRNRWWFWRFHNGIQWFQKPIGVVVEIVWSAAMLLLIAPYLR